MSDTDRQLGRAEQELAQAISALQACSEALGGAATIMHMQQAMEAHRKQKGSEGWTFVIDYVESAKRKADLELALHASRQAGTECAAVGRDVLLAGLGVTK
jgi:hypothetical protein